MRFRIDRILLIGIITLFVAACGKDPSGDIAFKRGEVPDEVFEDFVTQETDSGRAKWKLTAPLANRYNAKNLVLMDKPKIEFYGDGGELQTTLTSDKGEYYENTRDMLAYGNVVVVSIDGDVLETDSLLWVNARDKIISNCFVKLTRGKDVITGIGLECDHDLSSVDIKENVKATIIEEEESQDE
ncbi:MAG: LPS export ABC transporter periplasmic protein LptC [Candidatus Latescibacteria bacterium]|nr:LPS export ABC transporter periplasmic protein LptC [Candidatus Latescibacterota bacterium]NIM22089.1 LPS export ABC transporter periplasmic protein LptC [Candidatus Latescibacterota bacterium]NIM66108.1 LPS export ABC transporter periplasmic protein LptC [Candidatus Latescibacterota bacterium]NIO02516.1 LPS export ABC transporter periplasmic protein LptC [Candidatus Latescibacterota bacterium]NIO29427.1 LPS export ABC transporter periplasmic protein LptC [Candidatus Latescibacterota bacteri